MSIQLFASSLIDRDRGSIARPSHLADSTMAGVPTTTIGPPTTGAHVLDGIRKGALGGVWKCTLAGTPGTWKQIRPAGVMADPATGTILSGYLILNVTQGTLKRHAGGYS